QFYIDGVPAGSFTPLGIDLDNSAKLLLGSFRLANNACSCEVSLDEIELFNTELSPADIKSIFQADKNGKCKATITGVKFEDLNGNGVRDVGEPGLANWTIKIIDQNNNTYTVTTDAQGNYSFTVPAPASYTVAEALLSGWTQTAPPSGSYLVSVAANQSVNLLFGNWKKSGNKCDLVIKKEVKPNPLISGQPAQVIVTVTNIGNQPCHGPTTVTESLPPVSAGGPGWNCVGAVCTYPQAIMGGQTVSVTYNYNVTASPGSVIKNCAGVKNNEDSDTTNNEACVEVKVDERKPPDLSIVKTAKCAGTLIGMICKIGFTITNNGPGTFTGTLGIQDSLSPSPTALVFPSGAGNPPGWNCAINLPANLDCSGTSPVTLNAGGSTSLSLEVILPPGEYKNCAKVNGYFQSPFTAANMVSEGTFNNNESCVKMAGQQPDSSVWAVNLGVNARVNSEVTIQNSCRGEHTFAVTPRNLPFLKLTDKPEVKVRGGSVEKLKALFDTAGMGPGTYEGVVEITCVTCQKDPACKQDRQTVPVRLTVTPTARSMGPEAPGQNPAALLRLGPTSFSVLAAILVAIITM
ncbi:MAG: SdrD B-like domain-containing protein, partial [Pyrinomonadaceae bacterium]